MLNGRQLWSLSLLHQDGDIFERVANEEKERIRLSRQAIQDNFGPVVEAAGNKHTMASLGIADQPMHR